LKTTSLHLLHRRRRGKNSDSAFPKLTEQGSVQGDSGGVIGFWLLPTSSGYVKLKIPTASRIRTVGKVDGKRYSPLNKVISVNSEVGSASIPVYPVINSINILSKFYSWIDSAPESLWSANEVERTQAMKSYQSLLIKNGFCFVIKNGDTIKWCGTNKKLLAFFIMELSGGKVFNPANLSLLADKFNSEDPGRSEMKKIALLNTDGSITKTLTIDSVFNSLFKKQGVTFSSYINSIKSPVISEFYNGKVRWNSIKDWEGIEDDKLVSVMEADTLMDEFIRAGDKKSLLRSVNIIIQILSKKNLMRSLNWDAEELKRAVQDAPELAELMGKYLQKRQSIRRPIYTPRGRPPQTESLKESTLIEASFRDLLNDTASNGRYKIGGLRRVGRIWVYDRTIPDRVSNSRFVVTRRPVMQLDTDGFPIYKFQFRSRPDRNTTSMAHQGYVKFVEKPKFLARIRDFFKEEIDLQVHVHCACPDFKYRWHWVLAGINCSHEPTGLGFDAIDRKPDKTNPNGMISMCKHLVVAKDYLLLSANEHYKIVKNLQKASPLGVGTLGAPNSRKIQPGAAVVSPGP